MKVINILIVVLFYCFSLHGQVRVEKWQVFELTLNGPSSGNPFEDITLSCSFSNNNDTISISGFYDGDGLYKIRFMPQKEGKWMYTTSSNEKKLSNKKVLNISGDFSRKLVFFLNI